MGQEAYRVSFLSLTPLVEAWTFQAPHGIDGRSEREQRVAGVGRPNVGHRSARAAGCAVTPVIHGNLHPLRQPR